VPLIVISNNPDRVEAHQHLWGDFEVFTSLATDVRQAHHDLALHAVEAGWDETYRVIQDDVVVESWPPHKGLITSYYPAQAPDHTCPKAFTATPVGWRRLALRWRHVGFRTCELWHPDHWYSTARNIVKEDL